MQFPSGEVIVRCTPPGEKTQLLGLTCETKEGVIEIVRCPAIDHKTGNCRRGKVKCPSLEITAQILHI